MKYIIEGGKQLKGEVTLSGAKNSALKLMAASILTKQEVILENVPKIGDVFTMIEVLKSLGVRADFDNGTLVLKADNLTSYEAPFDLVSKMRASIIVLGPLLARLAKSRVALPGGCKIGLRKIDIHIRGLEELGAKIEVSHGFISAQVKRLTGKKIELDFPSVGATENLLMAAVLAKGTTIIENAAREPEIADLANFLSNCGADITGIGTDTIKIEGVKQLKGCRYRVIQDRIEAGTYLAAAACTKGDILIKSADASLLTMVIHYLKEAGLDITANAKGIRARSNGCLRAIDLVTLPYPGFPTDLQGPLVASLAVAKGSSIVTENVFENRFILASELNKMGASVSTQNHHAVIKGVPNLIGTKVKAPDLRGGAALIIAGLLAKGETVVEDAFHVERGYEDISSKLQSLGADIRVER
ncbi:MAG: UDP-N-acetylglucosamine 1-carboxyvinyltransferase [Actinobacteria bacterium]|nr:MAG: UDP-N-acetylglucosamine 1-carboxyvinyltransferase [Actinomycetota bacterium]